MTGRLIRFWGGLALMLLSLTGVLASALERIVPGWPAAALSWTALGVGLWLYLSNCLT
jgi:hypothetical protein